MRHNGDPQNESWNAVIRFLIKYGITVRENTYSDLDAKGVHWFNGFQRTKISFNEMVIEHDEHTDADELLHEGIHLILGKESTEDNEAHVLLPFEWAVVGFIAKKLKSSERTRFLNACDSYQRGTIIYDRRKSQYMQLLRIDRYADFWQRGLKMAIGMGVLTPDHEPTYKIARTDLSMRKVLDRRWVTKPNQERMRYMMLVVPAYYRDYKSKAEIEQDLLANKDFKINDISSSDSGRYINLKQLKEAGIKEIRVRYKKLTMSCLIVLDKMKPLQTAPGRTPRQPEIKPLPRTAETQSFIDALERAAGQPTITNQDTK